MGLGWLGTVVRLMANCGELTKNRLCSPLQLCEQIAVFHSFPMFKMFTHIQAVASWRHVFMTDQVARCHPFWQPESHDSTNIPATLKKPVHLMCCQWSRTARMTITSQSEFKSTVTESTEEVSKYSGLGQQKGNGPLGFIDNLLSLAWQVYICSKKSTHWLLCLGLCTALLEQIFRRVSRDPIRSTGFNGSVLNLLTLPQIGITSLVFGKYHWGARMSCQPVGPGRPFGVTTAPDLPTTHWEPAGSHPSWARTLEGGVELWNAGEQWRWNQRGFEDKIACNGEQLWFQLFSFLCVWCQGISYMLPVNVMWNNLHHFGSTWIYFSISTLEFVLPGIQVVDKRAQQPLQLALTLKELSVAGHDSIWFPVIVSEVGNG